MSVFLIRSTDELVERKAPPPMTGRHVKILIDPANDPAKKEAQISLAMFRYEPRQEGPFHSHEESAKVYFTLKGMGTVKIDNLTYEVKPRAL